MEKLAEKSKSKIKVLKQNIEEEITPLVLVAFVFSTGLMIFQHSRGWAWDFTVYSMIGEYIFHDGIYMEWLRPPVASTIMGLFQFVMSIYLH